MTGIDDNSIPLIAGTLLFFILGIFIIFFIVLYKRTQLKFEIEKQQFQQALLNTEIEIREQTLLNVSRELHDNLGQLAALIKINLSQLQIPFDHDAKIQDSLRLISQIITEIKSISTSLNSDQLKKVGLETAIELDVQRINKLGLIKLELHKGNSVELSSNISIFLYRIYQEIINNVLSHSQATNAEVNLSLKNNLYVFRIKDNGIGFSSNKKSKGNGLQNIKTRCEMIGASLNVHSEINNGTEIFITLPIEKME